MNITLTPKPKWHGKTLTVFMFEGENRLLGFETEKGSRLAKLALEERFGGEFRRTALLHYEEGKRLILSGLGRRAEFAPDRIRVAMAKALRRAEGIGAKSLGILLPGINELRKNSKDWVIGVIEGAVLAGYRDLRYRKLRCDETPPVEELTVISPTTPSPSMERAMHEALLRAKAVCYVRDLVNEPSGTKAPLMLAERARALTVKDRICVQIMDKCELEKMGMGGILGVGKGSHNQPCLVHLTYIPKGKAKKVFAFVGKGITFDSGGLSLKTAEQMELMKDDMSGAAVVFGLFQYLAEADLPFEIHGIAPLAENLPGGGAQKPGDIIRQFNGKTVEVVNTDAEGRLLLADALAYASTLNPVLIVDIATLTGACVIALGNEVSGILGNDQRTIERLIAIGQDQGELLWQLPLIDRYRAHLRSLGADLKNVGKPRNAGTIIGGLFLSEFVGKGVKWVHIDIAGTAFTTEERDYTPPGATGVPLRTLIEFLNQQAVSPR